MASTSQSVRFAEAKSEKSGKAVRIGVLGASGYTGSEVLCSLIKLPITLLSIEMYFSNFKGEDD